MNAMKAMNASFIHSPLFCEYAGHSLVEAFKALEAVQRQAVSCIV
jgi:hypothetical protein